MKVGDVFNPWRLFSGIFIPEALVRYPAVSPGAKLAYGRLARYKGEKGEAYPSYQTLGTELGVSRKQAKRYVEELRDSKFVRLMARDTGKGDPDTNNVIFIWHTIFDGEGVGSHLTPGVGTHPTPPRDISDPTGRVTSDPRGGVISDPQRESVGRESIRSESIKHQSAAKSAADAFTDARFEQFWAGYWRKVGKKPARAAFGRKVKTEEIFERVLAAVKAQTPTMLAREPEHRPHAATWLNQERWNDEPAPAAQGALALRQDRFTAHDDKVSKTFTALVAERMAR